MRARDLKRLVVNASVARAAGGKGQPRQYQSTAPNFLKTFKRNLHTML